MEVTPCESFTKILQQNYEVLQKILQENCKALLALQSITVVKTFVTT